MRDRCLLPVLLTATLLGVAPCPAAAEPVKVFILAGQSNMVGYGKTLNGLNPDFDPKQPQSRTNQREVPGGVGCLAWAVQTMPGTYGFGGTHALVDARGDWLVRDDVSVYARMEVFQEKDSQGQPTGRLTEGVTRKGPHTVGFGKANSARQKWNGPEFGFGHVVGNALSQDVLIIKVATGGTSLQVDWRSPTAVSKRGGAVGFMWTHLLDTVNRVVSNLDAEFPAYAGRGYEIAGFGWHQGWNDRVNAASVDEYEANLVDFIADVRGAFGAGLPFVIATTGMEMPTDQTSSAWKLVAAQAAVADAAKYPAHAGNVAVVDTVPMYRDRTQSPSTFGYHWNHNGLAYFDIGAGMGAAMLKIMPEPATPAGAARAQ